MATATLDEKKLKNLLKSAFAEALEEHRSLVQDIVEDAIEDIALVRAIEQGLHTKTVSRRSIEKIIEGKARKSSSETALRKTSRAFRTRPS